MSDAIQRAWALGWGIDPGINNPHWLQRLMRDMEANEKSNAIVSDIAGGLDDDPGSVFRGSAEASPLIQRVGDPGTREGVEA